MSRAILIMLFSLLSCSQTPVREPPSEPQHESSRPRPEPPQRKPLDEKDVERRLDDASGQLEWLNRRLAPSVKPE